MPASRPKKLPEEYSTNPNTIRARKRKARLSPFAKEVEQARASDAKALTRAWKQRAETDTYMMASEEERKTILASCEEEVMNRRRQKGLDADSKISRFMGRMESEKPGSRPAHSTASSGTSAPPIGPVDPALSPKQPVAAMGPPLSQVSRGYGAPYSPYIPHIPYNPYNLHNVLPSIEDGMHTESPFPYQNHMFNTPPKHGHYNQHMHPSSLGHHSHFNHMHPQVHDEETKYQASAMVATPDAFHKTKVPRDMDEAAERITTLEHRIATLESSIKTLETDLAAAKNTIAAQGECTSKLDKRMQKYDAAVKGVNDAEHNFNNQSSLLERVLQGFQRIADVASEVAQTMRSNELGDGNEDDDDDSGIGPDATMT